MKIFGCIIFTFLVLATSAFANVTVSSPTNGATVGSPVPYVATATTSSCTKGVASMGIYVDGSLVYVVNGASMNTHWTLAPGTYSTVVEEWDYCGGATYTTVGITVASQTGVWVTSPANNSQVVSPANYVASATTTCSKGVASTGIYVDSKLTYVAQGASLNTQVPLSPGSHNTVVEEWDNCGGAAYSTVKVTVAKGAKLSNIQANQGWNSWGQLPPAYVDCSPCSGLNWSTKYGITSPSKSGNATQFNTSGTVPYGVVLWYNPVIGQFSTEGLPDDGHTLIPSLHNFTYDTDFYVTNPSVTQVLEFDVSMYMDSIGMFWGTQCNHLGGGEWDVLDNVTQQWSKTSVTCNLVKGWNHLTLQFQRESDNSLLYQSITLNGVTANINETFAPFTVPSSWYGITVNYQMDGDYKQSANTTYLDNLSLTYW
ncbi:MAG TPA: Ig-like domain-containing protein [Terriglobales bacterium]|nr:Ig-like domain-containing protein [Terriglobales bacterium]